MSIRSAHRGESRKADMYGLAGYPAVIREPVIAVRMMSESGLRATLAHVWTICLLRLHHLLYDRRRRSRFACSISQATNARHDRLRTTTPDEIAAAVHCAPVPCKTILWSFDAAGVDAAAYHFVDVGSGWGYALAVAVEQPFPSLTGIEFAGEFHDMAVENFRTLIAKGDVERGRIKLKHESALETALPDEPLLIMLANPFGEAVMKPFLERVAASYRSNPRPILVVYINPAQANLFDRPDVKEMALRGTASWKLRWFSPFQARAYRWGE